MKDYPNEYAGANILITGGAGCIGSNLTKSLIKVGAGRIIVLDDLSASVKWNVPDSSVVHFIQASILDDEVLRNIFTQKVDFVFHLAAHFANQNSVDNPETDLMVNGMGILKTLEHARLAGVERFIYASSGCGIYGLDSKIPFKEKQ